jgi:hypothetical protein
VKGGTQQQATKHPCAYFQCETSLRQHSFWHWRSRLDWKLPGSRDSQVAPTRTGRAFTAGVAWDTSIPSLSSSPRIRGAPQSGFVRLILRMSSRAPFANAGLPGCPWRLFQVQYSRSPLRCQAITVSGLTMASAECQPDQRRISHVQKSRSAVLT